MRCRVERNISKTAEAMFDAIFWNCRGCVRCNVLKLHYKPWWMRWLLPTCIGCVGHVRRGHISADIVPQTQDPISKRLVMLDHW